MKERLLRTLGLGAVLAALLITANNTLASATGTCTSDSQCPEGTLCCYPCGHPGCQNMCLTPINGHCLRIP